MTKIGNIQTVQGTDVEPTLAKLVQIANANPHAVSPRYQRVGTGQLVDTIADHCPHGTDIKLHVPVGLKSTKHMVEAILPNEIELFGTKCKPRVLLWNSYLGECSLQVDTGLFRFICANGMRIGDQTWGLKGTLIAGDTLKDKLRGFSIDIKCAIEYLQTGQFVNDIHRSGEAKVGRYKAIEIVQRLKISQRLKEAITYKLIHPELIREEDKLWNVWSLYNLVNEEQRLHSRTPLTAASGDRGIFEAIKEAV